MRKLIVGLLGVLSLGVLLAGTAASASAVEWLCGNEAVLTAGNCKTTTVNLEVLLLEDRGVPASVECPVEGVKSVGTVGPGAADETTEVTFTGCKPAAKALNLKEEEKTNGCTTLDKQPQAVNTPWKTTVGEEEAGPLWWDRITSATKTPGYKITCTTLGIEVADTCEGQTAEANITMVLIENLSEAESGILLVGVFFTGDGLSPAGAAKCSVGGNEQGFVTGEQLLTATINGNPASLEVS